ncbi:MAG TPA: signal peptidase I [Ruminococcaceae bacterium]|nr:signal peptidase I [Oscillospiraceae bacterium]
MRKKIPDILFILATGLLVVLCAVAWLPRCFGYSSYYILTDSMKPSIPKGSMVFAKPIAFENIQKGDVLVFENSLHNKNFVHRVVALYEPKQWVFTKGDNNPAEDPLPTEYEKCKGVVQWFLPLVGYPAQFVHSTTGKIVIAVSYCLWGAVELELLRSRKKRKEVCA